MGFFSCPSALASIQMTSHPELNGCLRRLSFQITRLRIRIRIHLFLSLRRRNENVSGRASVIADVISLHLSFFAHTMSSRCRHCICSDCAKIPPRLALEQSRGRARNLFHAYYFITLHAASISSRDQWLGYPRRRRIEFSAS